MAKGESIEALLAPQLRVSRPVAACSRCRCAKIKCDGKLPACTACERADRANSCSGATDEFAKGKERNYVAALEAALNRLQRRVAATKRLQATDPSRRDTVAASYILGPGHALQSRNLASGGRKHRKEASDVDNLVGDFGFLSVNATSRDFHGFTATMSFARLLLAASKTGDPPQVGTRSLPPRYNTTSIMQDYLDEVFVLMPFFSETEFMASVSAVYAETGRHAKPMDEWMVRMVLAIAAAKSSQEEGDANWRLAQEYVSAALGYAEDVLRPGSVAGIQAILLLVQYSMVDPDLFSCWHLIGFASRVMVDLGLHNETAAEVRVSKDEIEMRRRVFYCVYIIDRSISMAFDRAFSFSDDSVSVKAPMVPHSTIPSNSERNTGPQLFLRSLQPSSYLFDIRRVQSVLHQETRTSSRSEWPTSTVLSYTKSTLTDIRSWASSIPATVSQSHGFFFRLESLYSQTVTLAPSCRNPNITELSRILIFEYAVEYADLLYPTILDNRWHTFFTVIDSHRINYIGRQFLSVMWASFDHLLIGALPPNSPMSSPEADETTESSPPPSPNVSRPTSALENCTRAIRCLSKTNDILAYAHRRFGNSLASLKIKFEQESATLMNELKMKHQELGTVQYITGGPPGQQLQQQQRYQPQLPQQPLRPIGLAPGAPIPPGPGPLGRSIGLPLYEFDIEAERQAPFLPRVQPPLSVPGPQPRDLTYRQDLLLPPGVEQLPHRWLPEPGPPGNYGTFGPRDVYVPPADLARDFLAMSGDDMPRDDHEFVGSGKDGQRRGAGNGG